MNEEQILRVLVSTGITALVAIAVGSIVNAKAAAAVSAVVLPVAHQMLDDVTVRRLRAVWLQ